MSATRTRRSAAEWDELALEVVPELQAGVKISHFQDRVGSNMDALRIALARQGYDVHGEPYKLSEISAARPATLANRVAKRRREKAPWWLVMAETGKSYNELVKLLKDHNYTIGGEATVETNGASPDVA